MNNTPQDKPEIGMGATSCYGTDCYPHTIVAIPSPKTIVVQSDNAVMAKDGDYFGNQIWDITPNPDGGKRIFTLRKNGGWYQKGFDTTSGRLVIGHRRRYEDPHF